MRALIITLFLLCAIPAFGQGKCGGRPCPAITPTPQSYVSQFWSNYDNRQVTFISSGVLGIALILLYLFSYKKDSADFEKRIEAPKQKQSGDMNRFAASRETGASKARTDLGMQLAHEVTANYTLESARDKAEREEQEEIARHKNTLTVNEEATRQKRSVATYDSLKLEEGLSQIRLLEAEGLKDLEWQFLEREFNLQLAGAMALAIKDQRQLEGLTDMFEKVIRKRHQIETGADPPEIKTALVTRFNKNLQLIERRMDGEDRLLQEVDREEP